MGSEIKIMLRAIVYTSNTGYTEEYAKLLGEETRLPVYSLADAGKRLEPGSEIIYLGWIMAGTVKGYPKAAKLFRVSAVCGVGMGRTGSQISELRKANNIPESLPVFTAQGGFSLGKLRGAYWLMMKLMSRTVGKNLAAKTDRTPDENDMLELMQSGGSRVKRENLKALLEWYGSLEEKPNEAV